MDDNEKDFNLKSFSRLSSIGACQDQCKGFNFFALQNGNGDCFCGNKFATKPKYSKVDDSECGSPKGNAMGGGWRNAVFIYCIFKFIFIRFIATKIIKFLLFLHLNI